MSTALAPEMEHRVAELLTHLAGGLTEPIQATLQGPTHAIRYEACTENNALGYADRQGFEGFAVQYAQETKGMHELEEADVRGAELVSMLYTYRSIASALPTVTGSDDHKKAMYAASFEVLHPCAFELRQSGTHAPGRTKRGQRASPEPPTPASRPQAAQFARLHAAQFCAPFHAVSQVHRPTQEADVLQR